MINLKRQHGGVLTSTLSFILFTFVLLVLCYIVILPYASINAKDTVQLQNMIQNVKHTPFEKVFNDRINYDLKDGKITNKEFNKITEFFNAYQTIQLTGNDQEFIAKAKLDLEQQKQSDKINYEALILIMKISLIIITLILIIFGYRFAKFM